MILKTREQITRELLAAASGTLRHPVTQAYAVTASSPTEAAYLMRQHLRLTLAYDFQRTPAADLDTMHARGWGDCLSGAAAVIAAAKAHTPSVPAALCYQQIEGTTYAHAVAVIDGESFDVWPEYAREVDQCWGLWEV